MKIAEDVSRREFLRTAGRIAAAFGLGAAAAPRAARALEELYGGVAPVLWLQGSNCSGCSVSLLNSYPLMPVALLTKHISLKFHQTLSTTQGAQAVATVNETITRGGYVLVVEGAVPAGIRSACTFGGENFADLLARAAQQATHVMAAGACSSFGGIPAAAPNPIGAVSVESFLTGEGISKPLINVPGCPPHPDWMVGTIVHLLGFGVPALDTDKRPTAFFGRTVHSRCPLGESGEEAEKIGEIGCMEDIGCRGERTHGDCGIRLWNGISNCLVSQGGCIGCTSPNFARDGAFHPEYHDD
jgi:hydrogenase small subunit